MPYIKQERRKEIETSFLEASGFGVHTPGELNYVLTRVVVQYMDGQREASGLPEPNYSILAEAVGALECAKLELYRRIAAPYEDRKRVENGDVYDANSL